MHSSPDLREPLLSVWSTLVELSKDQGGWLALHKILPVLQDLQARLPPLLDDEHQDKADVLESSPWQVQPDTYPSSRDKEVWRKWEDFQGVYEEASKQIKKNWDKKHPEPKWRDFNPEQEKLIKKILAMQDVLKMEV
jgi:hypothetical protein